MPWVAPALGIASTLFGAHEQNKAANAQVNAGKDALALQQQMWQMQQQNEQPFMQYGQGALGGLGKLMGGDYSGFENSPDFKARVDFANQQFNNGAAAKFRLFSGGAQNDRDALNQQLAAQGLGDYRNFLEWGANLGQNAATGVGQAGQTYANNAGNLFGQMADAKGTGYGANAGALYGLAGLAQQYLPGTTSSSYGGGSSANNFGLPAPVDPYANTNYGKSWYS